jgi:ABC-2 type transport system ATP-binding protein
MFEAIALRKEYSGKVALKGLNLKVQPGDIYCLLGANGAGKSTTINLFLDFIEPTSGQAVVDGMNVRSHSIQTKQVLAYIPEIDAPHRRVGGYSKGMRQKVGIAIAISKQAKALLLDEPTSGLDPKASNEFSDLLKQLSQDGVAILMATHDLFRAKETGNRAGIMRHGELVADLSTADIGHAELEALYLKHMHD